MQQHLCVRQGELYVWHYDKSLAVIPPKVIDQVILKAHLDPLHTHLGADKLEYMLRQYVYIEHIHDNEKEVVKHCGICHQVAQLPHSNERAPIALKNREFLDVWQMQKCTSVGRRHAHISTSTRGFS